MLKCPYCGFEFIGSLKTLKGFTFCPNCCDTFYITSEDSFIIHDYDVPEMLEARKELLVKINEIVEG